MPQSNAQDNSEFCVRLKAQMAQAPNISELLGQLAYANGYIRALRDRELITEEDFEKLTLEFDAERWDWIARSTNTPESK